ncbi:MAG: alpha-glucuronidase [Bacteroidaceae bacterium]|nr:alpha-glucuronidase [Bacteroidaceae bacterium]
MNKTLRFLFLLAFAFAYCHSIRAEDGSDLWLRYNVVNRTKVSCETSSPMIDIAKSELEQFCALGRVELVIDKRLPDDGFRIKAGNDVAEIRASCETGLLYGTYALLRQQETTGVRNMKSIPRFSLRLLNHWDNLNGSIERGYAGKSLWKWEEIDGQTKKMSEGVARRVVQYCRANASLGINGSVLNNVNASPKMLSDEYLAKVAVLADVMRPYGIRTFLSINFASPMALGDTDTADPLNPQVRLWWKAKVEEIYRKIPDFGGFLVKANSEGQPGPGDYKRTHAEGANMLAEALEPHGGIVMWRSFVYGANHKGEDRVKQAVSEFKPMDGLFHKNVILQSKNGPLDFQPREPYAPIFDNIKRTPQMVEFQVTQEYLGQSKHLVYLAPMWKEFFTFVSPDRLVGIAGVANIGDDPNYCGHPFSQANWYAFGRLSWDPSLSSEEISREWLQQTFAKEDRFVASLSRLMEGSREDCVDYMMPLGLHHIFKFDHHYGPEPDGFRAEYPLEWCPVYYHKADAQGIGFERSEKGTDAVSQYRNPYRKRYNSLKKCPEEYLLWFHHVDWNHPMRSGKTLWESLVEHYDHGVSQVKGYRDVWQQMKSLVDSQRWQEVDRLLEVQYDNAQEWRDICLEYFGKMRLGAPSAIVQ